MTGKRVGYIRVSTADQNTDRQLANVELDKKFIDKASGKSLDRPQLKAMLEYVREDDIVFVHSMDRLGRNAKELRKLIDDLIDKKISIQIMTPMQILVNGEENFMSRMFLEYLYAFADFEYKNTRERQLEGIAIARAKGVYKRCVSDKQLRTLIEHMKTATSKAAAARNMGISHCTLYRYLKLIKERKLDDNTRHTQNA